MKDKKYVTYTGKFRGVAHSICNLKYKVPKKIPVVFHNGSTYDWHFIIKQLAQEFEDQFECLGENTEKYFTFSVPIKKEIDNDDDDSNEKEDDDDSNEDDDSEEEAVNIMKEGDNSKKNKTITYKIQFIESYRFMSCKLSDLVNNLSGIYIKKCKSCMKEKEIRIECKFIGFKNNRLNYRCKEYNKPCTKSPNEAIKNFPIIYKFCNGDLDKFFPLLEKGVYPYEYIDSWEKCDETLIPPKEAFYSELKLENITDEDYAHVQKVWEVFKIKNLGEHDLYAQCDTILQADV